VLGCFGGKDVKTPHIDSLARDGAQFERFYVCPVCSPTRAEFLTGRYYQRGGVYSTSAGGERLDLDEGTIAEAFRAAGYATGAFGKWHNGTQYPYHPNARGFEEFYGFCSGHWGHYFSPMLERNGEIVTGEGYVVDDFTTKAIDFIGENRERPFFAYLPYNTPHSPMQVPDEYWDEFREKEITMHNREVKRELDLHKRAALAMCENIDDNVGRVLAALDEWGLSDNTIVLFFHDNGPNGYRWNGGMKGRKGSTDEGGIRSPLLVRWPAGIEAGIRVEVLGSAIDLLPTLLEMTGVERADGGPLDGVSLASALRGEANPELHERHVFSSWKNKFTVRTPRFRLDNEGRLFDLTTDPGQRTNVDKQFPEVHARLQKELAAYREEMIAELGTDERPFVIAHPDSEITWIPARDGIASGGITRSNKFPNDSFFENWTSIEDTITWEADVASGGTYEAEIYYTCPKGSEGSVIELRFGNSAVQTTIAEPHDPPLQGGAEDRFERVESYVKEFRPLKMGTIELEEGAGTLTLRALSKPGPEVMDFRLLVLRRVR